MAALTEQATTTALGGGGGGGRPAGAAHDPGVAAGWGRPQPVGPGLAPAAP
jgi:hypothetical protein